MTTVQRDIVRQFSVVAAVVGMITVNALATILPINNLTPREISDRFDVLFVPAAYVFSIWGLIYAGLLVFTVHQALPSERNNERLRAIAPWFIVSCAANALWIMLWHYEFFPLTVLVMLVLLASLIAIYHRLGVGVARVSPSRYWRENAVFSLYLAWICVATIANFTTLLAYLKWDGFGLSEQFWAVAMMSVGAILAFIFLAARRDAIFVGVVLWAFIGIAVKHAEYSHNFALIGLLCVGCGVIEIMFFRMALRRRKKKPVVAKQ